MRRESRYVVELGDPRDRDDGGRGTGEQAWPPVAEVEHHVSGLQVGLESDHRSPPEGDEFAYGEPHQEPSIRDQYQ